MKKGKRGNGRGMRVRWTNKGDGRAIREEGRGNEIEVQKR
jgi:hypothetical protein